MYLKKCSFSRYIQKKLFSLKCLLKRKKLFLKIKKIFLKVLKNVQRYFQKIKIYYYPPNVDINRANGQK